MSHQVMIEVTEKNGTYTFVPSSGLWGSGKFVFNKNDHSMKEKESHYIHFKLHPTKNAGLRFRKKKFDAMWVIRPRPGHECPDISDVDSDLIDYSVMGPLRRANDQELIAYNHNPVAEQWSFSLNFVKSGYEDDGDPNSYARWDPIGDNQDAGKPFIEVSFLKYAALVIGAGVVSALATVFALRGLGLL